MRYSARLSLRAAFCHFTKHSNVISSRSDAQRLPMSVCLPSEHSAATSLLPELASNGYTPSHGKKEGMKWGAATGESEDFHSHLAVLHVSTLSFKARIESNMFADAVL